jgi:hypothetical protein
MSKRRERELYRDAASGEIVTKEYAAEHPETTVKETFELDDQTMADAELMEAMPSPEEAPFHPILKVWREVLAPALEEGKKPVTPQWAARICAQYQQMIIQEMELYRESFYSKIAELTAVLDAEIEEAGPDALTLGTVEEDREENGKHYKNLLIEWQKHFVQWEIDWDCTSPVAHIELAAISEVHKMFFSQTGITGFLDNIGFEFPESDQAELAAALDAVREGQ